MNATTHKLIKTPADHEAALRRLEALMQSDPSVGSTEEQEIELLAFLIEDYEKRTAQLPTTTPTEAIRFRMDQAGLKQMDLVPFIGSKGRVSEVLSGKRELTLAMVRKLHEGLDIPLKALIQKPDFELPPKVETGAYPVKDMFLRGYFAAAFGKSWSEVKDRVEEMLQSFLRDRACEAIPALNRQTTRKNSKIDGNAVHVWRCRVLDLAEKMDLPTFDPEALNETFVGKLAALSTLGKGPLLAQERLHDVGVALVLEKHFTGTHLDGAAMWHPRGFPVVALTLRHDRLDNFWFTLFHELGHVLKHFNGSGDKSFIDADIDSAAQNELEREADRFALDAFILESEWDRLGELHLASEIKQAARRLSIHPAIIAGRLRREAGDYRKHRKLIGQREVKRLFWSEVASS